MARVLLSLLAKLALLGARATETCDDAPPLAPRRLVSRALQPDARPPGECRRYRNDDGTWSRRGSTDAAVHKENGRDYPPLLAAVRRHYPGPVRYVVDAGSNDGYSTWLFARALPEAEVLAIEPGAENYAMTVLNTRALDAVVAVRAALWGANTEMKVVTNAADWALRTKPPAQLTGLHTAAVPGVTLDALLDACAFPSVDFLKVWSGSRARARAVSLRASPVLPLSSPAPRTPPPRP